MKQLFFLISFSPSIFSNCQVNKDNIISLYYYTNEWQLDTSKIKLLIKTIPKITKIKRIEAFTDSIGTNKYNNDLSEKRGISVENFFKQHQLNPTEQTIFWGKKHSTKTSLSNNRRVDIYYSLKNEKQQEIIVTKAAENSVELTNTKDSILLNLENIFFIPDAAIVEPNSVPFLEELVVKLKALNATSIQIFGHSNKGSNFYYWLSEQRAKTIYDFLVNKGVDAKIISYIGLGNSKKLILHPETYDDMKKNMRVELLLKF